MSGTFPSQVGNLALVTLFDISYNLKMNGEPFVWSTTPHLPSFSCLGTIPTEIGRMTSLQEFRIYQNELTGTLPTSMGALTGLTLMMVKVNNLTGILYTAP